MDIALNQLPIPDWGLLCPKCQYPLKGLPSHRCPECGTKIKIRSLIRTWTRLRPPQFTGNELPLPDFGLICSACGGRLAGAPEHRCPDCGGPFDPQAVRPAGPWFVLDAGIAGTLPISAVQILLANERVPYIPIGERTVTEIYGGHNVLYSRLRVPCEFYFDVLWLLRRAERDVQQVRAAGESANWRCRYCGEDNPGHFEICWKCERKRVASIRRRSSSPYPSE